MRKWIVLPFENLGHARDVDWLHDASVNLLFNDLSRWQDVRVVKNGAPTICARRPWRVGPHASRWKALWPWHGGQGRATWSWETISGSARGMNNVDYLALLGASSRGREHERNLEQAHRTARDSETAGPEEPRPHIALATTLVFLGRFDAAECCCVRISPLRSAFAARRARGTVASSSCG